MEWRSSDDWLRSLPEVRDRLLQGSALGVLIDPDDMIAVEVEYSRLPVIHRDGDRGWTCWLASCDRLSLGGKAQDEGESS